MFSKLRLFLDSILLFVLSVTSFEASAQELDSLQNEVSEDFVLASVVVADRGEEIYSALGHACLRLQCPSEGLDYIFSYEAEDVSHNVLRFFAGNLKMRVKAVPTQEYVDQYRPEGRGVTEYRLNLPIEVKRRLWMQMDLRLEIDPIPYDYMNHGCAVSVLSWLIDAVDEGELEFAPWPEKFGKSRKELGGDAISDVWNHFFVCSFITGESNDTKVANTAKVIVPDDLVEILSKAKAYGNVMLEPQGDVLLEKSAELRDTWFTPLLASCIFFFLALLNLFLHSRWLRWMALLPALVLGLFVTYLVLLSDLPCTQWNWLIIPFNVLPLLLWKWRERWALPYAAICGLWVVGLMIYPHQVVDGAHTVLALTVILVCVEIKYKPINNLLNKSV